MNPEAQQAPQAANSGQPPICDYEGSDYQDRFWAAGDRRYEDGAEAAALRRLLPTGGNSLLEIGAGAGRNTPRYTGFGRIALLDHSLSQLRLARQKLGSTPRYLYVAADVYRLPFAQGAFDAATMIRTLHHMADPQTALASVAGVLQRDSSFVLEYANKRNLKAVLRWLVGKQGWNPFDRETVEPVRLNFNFHPDSVRFWLMHAGFTLETELAVSYFRLELVKRLIPAPFLVGLDRALQPTGRWMLLSPSVFLLARAVLQHDSNHPGAFWRCPACSSVQLDERIDGLRCQGCGRIWPNRNGIYDFRTRQTEADQAAGRQ